MDYYSIHNIYINSSSNQCKKNYNIIKLLHLIYTLTNYKIMNRSSILKNGCILYPKQYKLIYKVSYLSLCSCIYAIFRGYYNLCIVPGGVFLTSINYWRNPTKSWRKYIDIGYVNVSLIYKCIIAYNFTYARIYYLTVCIALSLYPISIYYYNKKKYWYSTYAHCMLHIIANISNFILYSSPKAWCGSRFWFHPVYSSRRNTFYLPCFHFSIKTPRNFQRYLIFFRFC